MGEVVAASFDSVARFYEPLERLVFRGHLQRARCAHLEAFAGLPEAARVLIVGEGDGRFLNALLQVRADLAIDVVDSSARMIALARKRNPGAKVDFHHQSIESNLAGNATRYEAIVTHFVLDCFTESQLRKLVPSLARRLKSDGLWFHSDFHLGSLPVRLLVPLMYFFFRHTTGLGTKRLVPAQPHLQAAGLTSLREASTAFTTSQVWSKPGHRDSG